MARNRRSDRPSGRHPDDARSKDTPVDPDVARFAARTFERQAAERDAKQALRDARRREEEHEQLIARKDSAAGEVKRLRTVEHVQPGDAAAAEAAYRKALAELIAFETGSAPAWAPASEVQDEPGDDPQTERDPGDEAGPGPDDSTPEEAG